MFNKPISEFSVGEIIQVLSNSGYLYKGTDFSRSEIEYIGLQNGAHIFFIAFENSEEEGQYYISKLFVKFDEQAGLLKGEFAGMPSRDDMTSSDVAVYFDAIRDVRKILG